MVGAAIGQWSRLIRLIRAACVCVVWSTPVRPEAQIFGSSTHAAWLSERIRVSDDKGGWEPVGSVSVRLLAAGLCGSTRPARDESHQARSGVTGRERRKGEDQSQARKCLGGILADRRARRLRAERDCPEPSLNEAVFLDPAGLVSRDFWFHQAERGLGQAEEAGLWVREIWEAIEKQRYVSDVSQAELIFVCFVGTNDEEKWQQSRRMQASLTVYPLEEVHHGRGSALA